MIPDLTALKQPIAIRPELVVDNETALRIQRHGNALSSRKFTVFVPTEDNDEKRAFQKEILHVDGRAYSCRERRHFCDASGRPLFDLYHRLLRPTWLVELPDDKDTGGPIARIKPKIYASKGHFKVIVENRTDSSRQVTLQVRSQDIWKLRTNVYLENTDQVVMTVKRTDKMSVYVPGKKVEWVINVAAGMDLSLASAIVVYMAAMMYRRR